MIVNNQMIPNAEIKVSDSRVVYGLLGQKRIPTYEASVTKQGKKYKKQSEDIGELVSWVLTIAKPITSSV